jgi:hypothetical protein
VTKDAKAAREERLLNAIALHILILEKGNHSLSHGYCTGCLVTHVRSPLYTEHRIVAGSLPHPSIGIGKQKVTSPFVSIA